MVIDFHTHCFPDRIAEKAIDKLSHTSALKPYTNGTAEDLRRLMKETGIDISVVLSIATNATQQKAVNDFAASLISDTLIPFGSVYPDSEDAIFELERIHSMGIKGVKFHPEYQNFYVDDEKMKPIYRKISELGLIVIFHAGEDYGYMPPYHATPKRLLRALSWLDTTVVAAHWGSQGMGQDTLKYLCGTEIYMDTAFGYGTLPKPIQKAIIEKHGVDKILFATDCPWHEPSMELFQLEHLDLTEDEKDKIKYKNAKKILGI